MSNTVYNSYTCRCFLNTIEASAAGASSSCRQWHMFSLGLGEASTNHRPGLAKRCTPLLQGDAVASFSCFVLDLLAVRGSSLLSLHGSNVASAPTYMNLHVPMTISTFCNLVCCPMLASQLFHSRVMGAVSATELTGGAFSKARWSQDSAASLYTVVNLNVREEGHLLLYKQVTMAYCSQRSRMAPN